MPEADVDDFSFDLAIGEGYKKFASELTRLSVIGIGAVATLWLKLKIDHSVIPAYPTFGFMYAAFIAFCLSAALGLAHLYYANDSLACEISLRRKQVRNRDITSERCRRDLLFSRCGWLLTSSSFALMIGILLFIAAVTTVASRP
jgi:hypothetical protein